ncbi:MAG: HEAT repeat domain-containing protein [Nitrospirae bacterium]|nr:MAG: HEAT repeat domain-containing protein [Nitrospirota bacterium]
MDREELRQMIADYMEKGFLENIVDMFLHDPALYDLVGELITDERIRVRIGVTALMEELARRDKENIERAIDPLVPLLYDSNPTVRGDAANLIALTGSPRVPKLLLPLLEDEDGQVREMIRETLDEYNTDKREDV